MIVRQYGNIEESVIGLILISSAFLSTLVFAIVGIKLKWFKQRMTIDELPTAPNRSSYNETTSIQVTGVYRTANDFDSYVEIRRPKILPPVRINSQSPFKLPALKKQNETSGDTQINNFHNSSEPIPYNVNSTSFNNVNREISGTSSATASNQILNKWITSSSINNIDDESDDNEPPPLPKSPPPVEDNEFDYEFKSNELLPVQPIRVIPPPPQYTPPHPKPRLSIQKTSLSLRNLNEEVIDTPLSFGNTTKNIDTPLSFGITPNTDTPLSVVKKNSDTVQLRKKYTKQKDDKSIAGRPILAQSTPNLSQNKQNIKKKNTEEKGFFSLFKSKTKNETVSKPEIVKNKKKAEIKKIKEKQKIQEHPKVNKTDKTKVNSNKQPIKKPANPVNVSKTTVPPKQSEEQGFTNPMFSKMTNKNPVTGEQTTNIAVIEQPIVIVNKNEASNQPIKPRVQNTVQFKNVVGGDDDDDINDVWNKVAQHRRGVANSKQAQIQNVNKPLQNTATLLEKPKTLRELQKSQNQNIIMKNGNIAIKGGNSDSDTEA